MRCAAFSMPTPQDLKLVLTTEVNEPLAEALAHSSFWSSDWRPVIVSADAVQLLIKTCPERLQNLLSTLE